jgi:hypothetical protein
MNNWSKKYNNGVINGNTLYEMSSHYNITYDAYKEMIDFIESRSMSINVNPSESLKLYDTFEKHINGRKHKLKRILNEN